MIVTAHMHLDRGGNELTVELSGTYWHAKEREDREIEDVKAHDSAVNVIDLTDEEFDEAIERLFAAADEKMASRAEDRRDR